MAVPYIDAPPAGARADYVLRAVTYALLLVMGVGAVWWTPSTIDARMPQIVTVAWGCFAIVGSLLCLRGSLARRYPSELVGLPLLLGSVGMYAITVWSMVPVASTRLAQAAAVAALAASLGTRLSHLCVVRWRARREADLRTGAGG